MLRRLSADLLQEANVPVGKATLPLFQSELEYNPPVHTTWNIVHIGMQVPESHQIYVCSDNCMRGVVMTAAEMNCLDRFHQVVLKEHDLYNGNLEEITIEGVTDLIHKMTRRPPMIMVFTVCLHHFMGSDYRYIENELNARFPDIAIVICYMDPIMQKLGVTPEMQLRRTMFNPIKPRPVKNGHVALLGCDVPLQPSSDLITALQAKGYTIHQLSDCHSYEDYLELGACETFICTYPTGVSGIRHLAKRLDRRFIYLPLTYDREEQAALYGQLDLQLPDHEEALKKAITQTKAVLHDTPITIDAIATPRPLGLAYFLLSQGFRVTGVYLDGVSDEELSDFRRLQADYPDVMLKATIHVYQRLAHLDDDAQVLAIGGKAAFFNQTPHFVNMVEGGGMEGRRGLIALLEVMKTAFEEVKDTKDLVVRKGLGCESCL